MKVGLFYFTALESHFRKASPKGRGWKVWKVLSEEIFSVLKQYLEKDNGWYFFQVPWEKAF